MSQKSPPREALTKEISWAENHLIKEEETFLISMQMM